MFDYAGAFHVHTDYSFDGTVGIADVVRAARHRGLDFIVVTDHFRMDARRDGWEGWHDGVLVIVGEEISPRHNHYLALGIETPVIYWKKSSRPQDYIDAVARQGGVGLIAHPDHTGAPGFGVKEYAWQDWSVTGYAGLSIWDLMTDWQEKLTSLPAAILAYIFPALQLSGPKRETLERWDGLCRQRKVAGYGEIDNHDSRKKMFGLTFRIFPFAFAFATIRTHVLLDEPLSGDAVIARRQVLAALQSCRLYVAQERWRKAAGFTFHVIGGENAAMAGDDCRLSPGAALEVRLPAGTKGRIRIVRDGVAAACGTGDRLTMPLAAPGVYRAEVEQRMCGRYRPWIYANPIWVRQ
jgi:hypothetical protein